MNAGFYHSAIEQVMWGQVQATNGFHVMAYDVPLRDPRRDLRAVGEARGGLGATQKLAPSGWAPLYGMIEDKFGVTWVLDVAVPHKASS